MENIGGESLDKLAKKYVFTPLDMENTCFNPDVSLPIAATEKDAQSGEYLTGVVHDENARYLGGVSGNAGVFRILPGWRFWEINPIIPAPMYSLFKLQTSPAAAGMTTE